MFHLTRIFNSVHKTFLACKLNALNICGHVNQWFVSFLEDRKFRVKVDDVFFDEYNIQIGTPQKSVLRPLIFLIIISNLCDFLDYAKLYIYADNTCLIVSDKQFRKAHS